MHKENFALQPRDWPTTSKEAWRFDDNLHCHGKTGNYSEWSEQTASSWLLVCECRWSTNLGDGCQFQPFGDGFWPPDIGLGVQPNVLGSLWSTGDAAVSGGGGTECGISDNGDKVSSVMSPSSPYTTVTVGSGCAEGKWRSWLMPVSSLMMEIVARQSWYGVQSTRRSELAVVDGAMNGHRYIQDTEKPNVAWATGVFGRKFLYVQDNAPPHTIRNTAALLDQQDAEVIDWPARSPDMIPIEHVWDRMSVWIWDMDNPHFIRSWIKQCCPLGVGCSLAKKGADPGQEHASSCQGSSGC